MHRHLPLIVILAVGGLLGAGCGDEENSSDSPETTEGNGEEAAPEVGDVLVSEVDEGVALEVVATGLGAPVAITAAPGDDRLYVLERLSGQIRIVDPESGDVLEEPFLDVGARLEENGEGDEQGLGERGLLGLAFHPDYAANGRLFVYYADFSGVSELVEYRVSDDPDRADADSAAILGQWGPTREHFGGALQFAPDGTLWFSIGTEGSQQALAADVTSPRGKVHRYDVSTPGQAAPAAGNPFLGDAAGADEVWAYGLRNPWRMTVDGEGGLVYIADVGEAAVEEINVAPLDGGGLDFGWPTLEGTQCQRGGACDDSGTVAPVIEVSHDEGACAIIGGPVYRGEAIPALQGAYLFSDYCGGFIRTFRYEDGAVTGEQELFADVARITSFGVDGDGEVYVIDQPTGTVRKLVPAP